MKQFKALLIKEWQTHWKTLLLPAWFLLAIYGFNLLILIYTYFKFGSELNVFISAQHAQIDELIWGLHFGSSIILGFLASLAALILADVVINQDAVKKCEIFHYSLPVSLPKILLSKLAIVTVGSFLIFVVLAVLNSLVMTAFLAIFGYADLPLALNGLLNSIPYTIIFLLFFPAVYGFFASLFKKNAFGGMIGTFVMIDIMIYLLDMWLNTGTFSVQRYFMGVIGTPLRTTALMLSGQYSRLELYAWQDLSSKDSLIRFGISAILIVATYFIIKRRELR